MRNVNAKRDTRKVPDPRATLTAAAAACGLTLEFFRSGVVVLDHGQMWTASPFVLRKALAAVAHVRSKGAMYSALVSSGSRPWLFVPGGYARHYAIMGAWITAHGGEHGRWMDLGTPVMTKPRRRG
jgi:hypothetical protein